jgi:monovalent cation:H+ antiporter-2, CPA2 family
MRPNLNGCEEGRAGMAGAAALDLAVLREPVVVLAAAAVVVPLLHRFRISPVLGFILCGVLLGPSVLGALAQQLPWLAVATIQDRASIAMVAEFGIMFLLFAIGLELSFERLKMMRKLVFGLGTAQLVVSGGVIAAVCWLLLDLSATASAVLGLALALSSTAVVLQTLVERKRTMTPDGRASFGVLLLQDLAVIPILFAVSMLSDERLGQGVGPFVQALGVAAVAVGLVILSGRLLLRPLFRMAARTGSPEIFMALCLLVVLVTGLVCAAAGLSMALGAFLAGLLLAETEYRREVEATIEPFKGLLLGVFLVSVGMSVDLGAIARQPVAIAGSVVALLVVKTLIVVAAGPLFGVRRATALRAGLVLAPGGEFAFVVLGIAMAEAVVPGPAGEFALLVVAITMCLIPLLAEAEGAISKVGRRGAAISDEADLVQAELGAEANHVIVAGFGRVGQTVVALLERHGVPYVAVDADPERVRLARKAGRKVYFGDATRAEFLKACGLATARTLVVTMDGGPLIDAVVGASRTTRPQLPIVARARDASHAAHLYGLGVSEAVPETLEASLQLGEAMLVEAGVPMGPLIVSIHEMRAQMREALLEASTTATPSERLRALRETSRPDIA